MEAKAVSNYLGISGLSLSVKVITDEWPDTSWLGEFVDNRKFELGRQFPAIFDRTKEYRIPTTGRVVGNTWSHGEYRYFQPSQHWPYDPREWEGVSEQWLADFAKQIGKPHLSSEQIQKTASLTFGLESWERMETLGRTWEFVGVVVAISLEGREVVRESLWGIEYNYWGDNSYVEEIKQELIELANSNLLEGLEGLAEGLEESAKAARQALVQLAT